MVPVDRLEPGMEVASEVVNLNGAVLLKAGTLLSPQHIRMLKMWGIDAIRVAGGDEEGARESALSGVTPEQREAAAASVRHRLKHVQTNMREIQPLVDLAILRTATRLAAAANQAPNRTSP